MPARKTIFAPKFKRSNIYLNANSYFKDTDNPKSIVYFIWCDNLDDLYSFCQTHGVPVQNIQGHYKHNNWHVYITHSKMNVLKRHCVLAEKYDKLEFKARNEGMIWMIPKLKKLRETRFLT
jgi:hypothetical protein